MKIIRIFSLTCLILASLFYTSAQASSARAALLLASSTPDTATPGAGPTLLAPAQDSLPTIIRPVFDWSDVPGALSYEIIISSYSNFAFPVVDAITTDSSFTPTDDLPRNMTIFWKVRMVSPIFGLTTAGSFMAPNPPYSPPPLSPGLGALVTTLTPTLVWDASPTPLPAGTTFAFYQLQVDDNADFSSLLTEQFVNDSGVTSYTFSAPLSSNTTYFWRVRTANTLGQTSMWRTSNFQTSLLPPTLISPLAPAVIDTLRPTLEWSDVPGASGYGVEVSFHPDFSAPFVSAAVSSSSYTFSADLPTGTLIFWRVRTHGASLSDWNSSSFTTPSAAVATATSTKTLTAAPLTSTVTPTGNTSTPSRTLTPTLTLTITLTPTRTLTLTPSLTPTGNTPTPSRTLTPTLTLTPSLSPTGNTPTPTRTLTPTLTTTAATVTPTLTRTLTQTPTGTVILTSTPTRTPTLTRTLTLTVTMTFTRTPTRTRTATRTPIPRVTLLAPAAGSMPTIIRPVFDWSDVPGATAYNIQVSSYSNFRFPVVNTNVKVSTFTPTLDLPRKVTLYWRVRVVVSGVVGPWVVSSFHAPNPPYSPPPLSPGLGALVTTLTPNLLWALSPTPMPAGTIFAYFQLQVDDDSDYSSPFIDVKQTDITHHSYTFTTPLAPNSTYYWRIRTANTLGQMSMWRKSNFHTALLPPVLIAPAALSVSSSLRPLLDWSDIPNATAYGVEVSLHPDFSTPLVSLAVTASSYQLLSDLPQSTVIYWHVRTQGAALSDWSSSSFTTPGPTPTPTPVPLGLLYQNHIFGYQFNYPNDATFDMDSGSLVQIHLTIVPGTNLGEKYMQTRTWDPAVTPCKSTQPAPPGSPSFTEVINSISFLHEEGEDAGVGNIYDWVSYSAVNGNVCVNMVFILHSTNPGNFFPTPPPLFDKTAESLVFGRIVHTFGWIPITVTATPTLTPTPTP